MKNPKRKTTDKTIISAIGEIPEATLEAGKMLEAIGDGISILDRTFNILYENEAHRKILGSHVGEKCFKAYRLRDGICGGCPVAETFKNGEIHTVLRHMETDAGIKYFEITASPLKDQAGKIIAGVEVVRDITERKKAEKLIDDALTFNKTIFEASPIGIITYKASGKCVSANGSIAKMVGATVDQLLKQNFHYLESWKKSGMLQVAEEALATGVEKSRDVHVVSTFGKEVWFACRFVPFQFENEPHLLALFTDITELKREQKALQETEQKLRNIIEHSNELYYVHDVNNVLTYVSPQSLQILGYTPDEMMIEWTRIVTDSPINEKGIENTEKAFKTGEKQGRYTLELYKKDGSKVLLEIDESPIKDEKGTVVGLAGAAWDVTEHVKAEEALKASEAELHDNYFAQSAINMILGESLEDRPLEEMLQKALNMILSVPWLSFEAAGSIHLVVDEPDVLIMKVQYNLPKPLIKSCAKVPFGRCLCGKAAQSQKIEFADHIDERHEICYEGLVSHGHYAAPLLFGGKTLGVIDVHLREGHIRRKKEEDFLRAVADTLAGIIARKRAEGEKEKLHAQLLQSQKMESIGVLAGGVAHDFNNILTAMIGYGELLRMKLKEKDPLRSYADHILSLSDKAAKLTQSLLAFSRKQIIDPRPIDLNEIIRRLDHLLSRIIGEDIRLQATLSGKELIVMADPGQVEQVLMNLATNAKDAMPGGGLLTIRTEAGAIDKEFIRIHGFGKKGPYALISMTDTGAGMDRETRAKIFEPFFTTKEVGKGTGLGLAMVYGIVKQNEGYINVYSEPGSGSTFRIYLPLIQAVAKEIKPEAITPLEAGTETILLAEDETEVRVLTKTFLENYGYRVIDAIDGETAIKRFKLYKNKIQLLLLDVIMPNKNGKEVYDEIKQIRPDIKVLFMSGHPADVIHRQGTIDKGLAYIEKPVSPTNLLQKIREVLGE